MARSEVYIILIARIVRMLSFGAITTVLFLHLQSLGLSSDEIGFLFSGTILGDLLMTIPLTTCADKWGRKRVLLFSACLKVFSGLAFALSSNKWILLAAGTVGVITPTGGEIGPFMAVEQAALTAGMKNDGITRIYSVYNFVGYFAQAAGAFASGWIVSQQEKPEDGYRIVFWVFTLAALVKIGLYSCLTSSIEPVPEVKSAEELKTVVEMTSVVKDEENANGDEVQERAPLKGTNAEVKSEPVRGETSAMVAFALRATGLKRQETLRLVTIISLLFIMDAFAGGLVMQTVVVAWFQKQFDMSPQALGALISGMNILAGISALLVMPLARFGPLNVAVFSHLPSNVLLMFVPFMPSAESASGMILARSTLSQMDVPARQAFVAISVTQEERSAAGGITMIVRSVGTILAPIIWSPMMAAPANTLLFSMPFVVAGAMKIVYDLLLYYCFRRLDRAAT